MSDATLGRATKRPAASQDNAQFSLPPTSIHRVEADGVQVFYRAAGEADAPVVLLLHGFPTSSFMFRELIPRLASDYRVIAPDLPGFGFTEVPPKRKYPYSFDRLAFMIEAFAQALKINRYAIYVFDYGAPTGFRLAMAHPDRVTAIVSQNGNAYEQGLGDAWGPIRKYWAAPTPVNRDMLIHLQEHSIRETAQILAISTGAVKSRMFHAKIELHRMPLLQSVGGSNCARQAE